MAAGMTAKGSPGSAGLAPPGHMHTTPPHYNVFGHQHHMMPTKEKSHLENQQISHARWLDPPPPIKSRAELQQARKQGRVPDLSYDFDGDGTVGQLDMFVGRSFDKNMDGRLTRSERGRAEKALKDGFLDQYKRGIEVSLNASKLRAMRGGIANIDNAHEISAASYQPHFNAHKVPPHATVTALGLSRKAEMKGYGNAVGERWGRQCAPVREPEPWNAQTDPRRCEIAHIRERAEADHQASRIRGGLMPVNMPCNPERELRTVGLGHVENPVVATRGQLLETRKEMMKADCEELRRKGEEHFPPMSVRAAEKEVREFEFRRPDAPPHGQEPKTLTTLKDDRKRDRIEYDMANFAYPDVYPREYPRYSDHADQPWWTRSNSNGSSALAATANTMLQRAASEPVLKVNHVEWHHDAREQHSDHPPAAHELGASLNNRPNAIKGEPSDSQLGSKTVKRYTSNFIEHGLGRNKPRIFDQIQPLTVGPRDLEDLSLTSSMEPIRRAALSKQADDRKRNGTNPPCSRLWTNEASIDSSFEVSQPSRMSNDRTQIAPRRAPSKSEIPRDSILREPRSFANPDLKASSGNGIRSGGFQKLDWIPQNTSSRPVQKGSKDTKTARVGSKAVAPPAPSL